MYGSIFLLIVLLSKGRLIASITNPPPVGVVAGIRTRSITVPWLVQIRLHEDPICGATLLNEHWILTAAHCFKGFFLKYYSASLGRQHKLKPEPEAESRFFSKLILHPQYGVLKKNDADLALIKMTEKVKYTELIQPASVQANSSALTKQAYCCVSGWGETLGKGEEHALNQVCFGVMATQTCNLTQIYDGILTNNMICAGFKEGVTDSCQGDSGGPLMCIYGSKWILEGLTSGGLGCGKKPGVYTKVANYYDWIIETMASN